MLYRRFGKTNLQMPVFSCGGMRYQQPGNAVKTEDVDPVSQKNLEDTIHRSIELGINHIETARGYGSSELQLGMVLPKLPREKIIVQTKIAPYEDSRRFLDTFDKSMSMLKLDHVDLLGIHGVNTEQLFDWTVRPGGCLQAARELQRQGRCRHVGFSTHAPLDLILRAIRHEDDGGFDYVNLHWYFILQYNWPAVEEATRRDLGVFIISPSDKGGKLYAPPDKLLKLTAPLHPITFNDLFCLSHPQIHTLSVGAARPTDFDLHVKTLEYMNRASDVLTPIVARLTAAMLDATGREGPEAGVRDLPDHTVTPGDINLQTIMWLLNLAKGWDMVDYAKMRYNLLGNGGHWFPGLSAAELEKVNPDDIRRLAAGTKYGDRIIELLHEAHDMLSGKAVKRLSRDE